jgi:hypothetical protein
VTYYPSAKAAAEGMPVVVNVRGPVTADITLKDVPLAVVAGTVVDHTGGPARRQVLHIAHGDNLFGVDSRAVQPRDDGAFALPGMPPGTYFLQMREGPWPPPRDLETPLISGARVVVDGKDVTNVRVVPIRMVRATGRIIVDPAVRAMLQPSTISVAANPVSFDGNPGPQRAGTVTKDLTFEFRTWPGRGWVRVGLESGQWKVKSIRYKGTDLTSEGAIDFVEGQDISDIEIELIRAGG